MSVKFVSRRVLGALATLAFVIVFNFFLFRVVESDPVATLFRGRNLTAGATDDADAPVRARRLAGASSSCDTWSRRRSSTWAARTRPTSSSPPQIWRAAWPTIALVGVSTLLSTVFGVLIGISAAWKRGSKRDYGLTSFTMTTYSMPDFWLGMLLLVVFGGDALAVPDRRDHECRLRRDRRREAPRPGPPHVPTLPRPSRSRTWASTRS